MAAPFLKWPGGKRWFVSRGLLPSPRSFSRFVEPFLGGGAVFFGLKPSRSILSDLNEELICLYRVMRDYPDELQEQMHKHHLLHNHSYYYTIRADNPKEDIGIASRLLYLNRTCWNGLYRVNSFGKFNVPIGTKTAVLFEGEDFKAYANLLQGVKLQCCDFEEVINVTGPGDFLFVDPPYTVQHNNNNFIKYNEFLFKWGDQVRLCEALMRAKSRGVSIVMANADHDSIRNLYADLGRPVVVQRHSILSGNPRFRNLTSEIIISVNM
jgi:DNA adenine methylase